MQTIKIKPAVNGWIVEIGCSTFVAEDKAKMLKEISDYIADPEGEEKKHLSNAKNKRSGVPPQAGRIAHYGGDWIERTPETSPCDAPT
jgi:hypothetical protein